MRGTGDKCVSFLLRVVILRSSLRCRPPLRKSHGSSQRLINNKHRARIRRKGKTETISVLRALVNPENIWEERNPIVFHLVFVKITLQRALGAGSNCWPWNPCIASMAGIKLEKSTCYWMPPSGAMRWALFLAAKSPGNSQGKARATNHYWSKRVPKDQGTVQNNKIFKIDFPRTWRCIRAHTSLLRLPGAKFSKSELAFPAGNFEVFAQSS